MKKCYVFTVLLCASFILNAQTNLPCGVDHIYNLAAKMNAAGMAKHNELEAFTKKFVETYDPTATSACNKIIPVVVHIIHNNGAENILDAQVYDAINILNQDFQKLNPDTLQIASSFKSIASNVGLEFRLAKKDPNGNPTTGITRTVSALTSNADDNVKSLISWDNSKYLNIWVVKTISFNAGGYAYFPGLAAAGMDGVEIVCYQFGGIGQSFGNNFAKRSLTHEVGHYFNLSHVWGNSYEVGDAAACGDSDGVSDTPPTIGSKQTCNLSQNSCGFIDNVQNYMDYATCTKMFTQGQKARMVASMFSTVGSRSNLWSPANLAATGVDYAPMPLCGADISTTYNTICSGASAKFTSVTWNGSPVNYTWSFQNGTPATSTLATPTVVYNTAGTHDVSLTVSNGSGSATVTKTGFMVVGANAKYNNNFYSESFESNAIPGADWTVKNNDNGVTWQQVTTPVATTGTMSAKMDNYSNATAGEVDELISPPINFSLIPGGSTIKFKLAFAQKVSTNTDKLQVYMSSNCGQNWAQRYIKSGANLATVPVQTTAYTPAGAGDWRTETISGIPTQFSAGTNVLFKFVFTSGGGNNIYIDEINIGTVPSAIDELQALDNTFSVYPNPSTSNTWVDFYLEKNSDVRLSIIDLTGREVLVLNNSELSQGDHHIEISSDKMPAKGVYLTKLQLNGRSVIRKMIVE